MELRSEGIMGQLVPVESIGDTTIAETRADLEKELQDTEFASYYGADQAKIRLAFTLVEARNRVNLTQKEVADTLKVSQPYIAKLERGDANPTIGKIGSMLAQLGLRFNMQAEPLLPQPVAPDIVFQVNIDSYFAVGTAAMPTGADTMSIKESPIPTLYAGKTSRADVLVDGSTYRSYTEIRKQVLVGGTVE